MPVARLDFNTYLSVSETIKINQPQNFTGRESAQVKSMCFYEGN